jgi:hypothetical protein
MKLKTFYGMCAVVIGCSAFGHGYSEKQTPRLGLNYTIGPSFIAGGSGATDVSSVEPGVGTGLQLGLLRNVDALFSYDYVDATVRAQEITFGGQYRLGLSRGYDPFVGAGIGFGKPGPGESWGHFALKLLGGVEKPITSSLSIAATLAYHYVEGPDPFGSIHTIEPGIRTIYYFGSMK